MIPDAIEVRLKPKERAVLESRLRVGHHRATDSLLRYGSCWTAADGIWDREIARE